MHTTNPEQQKIIDHTNGAILVLAPVGSGKTLVLSERVVRAIKNKIPPEKILCLTFTNRAAKEMSERLMQAVPDAFRKITIKTFHGLCASILRSEAREIGLPTDFVIYDETDCKEIIKEISGYYNTRDVDKAFFQITNYKSHVKVDKLSANLASEELFAHLGTENQARLAAKYQQILQQRHAVDFADLVFYVRMMFHQQENILAKWQNKFTFIQVDEVQDTHLSEYEIVRNLAINSGNIAMVGDLDQTIYQWRGSEPDKVIKAFREEFKPAIYPLTYNHRATQILLKAASGFAEYFQERQTRITPSPNCDIGEKIQVNIANSDSAEAVWIGNEIKQLAANTPEFNYNKIAVLARTNYRVENISSILEKMGIPCLTVEQYQFFNRQEVKDALAYLKLIINPFDSSALRRVLMRPSRGIGHVTIQNIINQGSTCGLMLTDMVSGQTFINGDPFSNLLAAYESGKIVVFDVETTGLDVSKDEVVDIAAVKLVNGRAVEEFQAFIYNTVDVGNSQFTHGYSNEYLREIGEDAYEVFQKFIAFCQNALLIGHNVGFDIKMVKAHASKVGIKFPKLEWSDTWNLANRFIQSDSYSLVNLAEKFLNISQFAAHQAIDDARVTVKLLQKLIPEIQKNSLERQNLANYNDKSFKTLAQNIESWRDMSQELRPAELLKKVLLESGLYAYYKQEEKRRQNLLQLFYIFHERDNPELHPDTAIRSIVEFTALAKNLDQISQQDNKVFLVTVHQSKGLEFDSVFIAGAVEGEFPFYLSQQGEELEEEKRLFYVAMTRAKKRLFISSFLEDSRGYTKAPSQFIGRIPREYLRVGDWGSGRGG